LVVVVTVVLWTSLVFASAVVHAGPTQAPGSSAREAARPAAIIAYATYNGLDAPTTSYFPGQSVGGTLYFSVTDTLDHAVNVTITDPDAARDSVATPAFHYEAILNTTTFSFNSYRAGVAYTFPASLPYGGHWVVNFSAPGMGLFYVPISVFVYTITVSTSVGTGATLPGQPITVFWTLPSVANDATLYTRATNVTITGHYTGNGTVQGFFAHGNLALAPTASGEGSWSGIVPANTTPDTQIHLEVYAVTNVSGQLAENASANVSVDVGGLTIRGTGLTPAPPTCDLVNDGTFATGTVIAGCVEAGALYHATFTTIAGLPVAIAYWNGTAHVSPAGTPTSLTTNATGEAGFTFLATSPPFVGQIQSPRFNALNFTVSVPGAGTHYVWTSWANDTFSLTGGSPSTGFVQVSLDRTNYYVGATAIATWAVGSTNVSRTGPVVPVAWSVTGPSSVTYAEGTVDSVLSGGTQAIPITEAMASVTIEVWVYAANATQAFESYASATVLNPTLLLTPASNYYTTGGTASVAADLNGGGTGATIQYQASGTWPSGTGLMANGTVANGSSLSVRIPSVDPPYSVAVDVWATVGGQVVATAVAELHLILGYSVQLGVTTASSYADGSYQPGQSVTLSYQVVAFDGAALPQVLTFDLSAVGFPTLDVLAGVAPSGSISYTIPSDAPQGTLFLELQAIGGLTPGECLPTGSCLAIVSLTINPHPSFLGWELGAGSGVTVGWLLLLVLLIVVAVSLLFLLRRRGGGRRSTGSATPTDASPSEWKEPAATPSPPAAGGGATPPTGPS
jgi:hypothetical protein